MTLEMAAMMKSGHFSMHNFQKEENHCDACFRSEGDSAQRPISSSSRVKGSVTAIGFDMRAQAKPKTTHTNRFHDGLRTYHA